MEAPFGSWASPLTARRLLDYSAEPGYSPYYNVTVDGKHVLWGIRLPEEKGRVGIMQTAIDGSVTAHHVLPQPYSCRTRVHEYGGGSFTAKDGVVYFSNDSDARIYKLTLASGDIKPITTSTGKYRYADFAVHPSGQYLVCVREEHFENEEPKDVVNTLVLVYLDNKLIAQQPQNDGIVIAQGNDFYSSPKINPHNPAQLAYVTWVHPNMPWDFTLLHVVDIFVDEDSGDLQVQGDRPVAGHVVEESIMQPEWMPDGTLAFASDRTNYWNYYSLSLADGSEPELFFKEPIAGDMSGPAWQFNLSLYKPVHLGKRTILMTHDSKLIIADSVAKTLEPLEGIDYTKFHDIRVTTVGGTEYAVVTASSPTEFHTVITIPLSKGGSAGIKALTTSDGPKIDTDYISVPQLIEFPTANNLTAFAYYYEPKNPKYVGPRDAKPPLRVLSHGGPTAACSSSLDVSILYWTTRGFAVVDVNYGGSTGYGREYRNRLQHNWGIVDVEDCCAAATYLVNKGLADASKLAIQGGSAGGYTTLASLAFRDVFTVGCSLYGVSDITLLAKDTHKFESRYPDLLIGEYPKDEKIYFERSPINSTKDIKCPVIFFQGKEDKIVPPEQSEIMVEALKNNGIPVAYVLYDGETHGFRIADNIVRTTELELWFYGKMMHFSPADTIEGVEIYNWKD
ncbi:hypothetical protein BZG36_04438 [Bifiguratus adelaidae]|uniref:Peptidase S9 prolyl oligopeptidase catalytic domain-containing protein n=1 Tax=Bifiguratus adelaidae TaxID=1938954 RepID=A0A261XVH8_9FUNG|nr:hypothetical protein BZG36_04438 [Bifiguratus adelaidae]